MRTLTILLFSIFVLVSGSPVSVSRRSVSGPSESPIRWTSSQCNIVSQYSKESCFNLRSCANLTLSINSQNETIPINDDCVDCLKESSHGGPNTTKCQNLIDMKQAGNCCNHQPHCCVEVYDICLNSTRCNYRCVQRTTSYSCTVTRDICFNMSVTITGLLHSSRSSDPVTNISTTFYPRCGTNDIECMDFNIGIWYPYTNINCWYQFTNQSADPEFRFSNPCYDIGNTCDSGLNSLAIFLITAGSILGGLAIIILGLFVYKKMKEQNKHYENEFLVPNL